jgi:hypothetical protein
MNAHFKPFAAIGYEYNRVRVQSGQARLGGTFQFSIPQFGDFFHDMVLHIRLGEVDATDDNDNNRFLRYVDFLGQRLLKNVKFQVNGNPLDEYDSDVMNFHEKFFVTPNKQIGWNRNVGQEVYRRGFVDNITVGTRQTVRIADGPQTPKAVQPAVEMWVPLLFWFNKDPRLSIPSVSIPYGQRFIDITLARAAELLQHTGPAGADINANPVPIPDVEIAELYINNIFVNPEIHDIYIKRIGFSLIRVHRRQTVRVNKSIDNLLLNQLKWPIETMYVGLRPTANIDEQSDTMLENWHVYAEMCTDNVQFCAITADVVDNVRGTGQRGVNVIDTQGSEDYFLAEYCLAKSSKCIPTISQLSIEAHGVPLYKEIPSQFFNSYVPYTYGGQHITTPEDCGALMITFNLYPGSYQPSGHVNISRAREFYLNYQSLQVGLTNPTPNCPDIPEADMVIIAIAINFLLISDGSAVLRYST